MKRNHLSEGIKGLRKSFYKGRTTNFKALLSIMLLVGLLSSGISFFRYAYSNYAISSADLILQYPEISKAQYPDGSRFTYYDLIRLENIEDALRTMQQSGKYTHYTAYDLMDHITISSALDGSAMAAVSSARSEGNDYSYVANEYELVFSQPHDSRNPNLLKRLFTPDESQEFLEALVQTIKRDIAEKAGELDGFQTISALDAAKDYDYSEKLRMYRTRILSIVSYLNDLNRKDPDFVSEKWGMSLKDVESKFNFLSSSLLDGISNLLDLSGISKDYEVLINKIQVNIENNRLKFNKYEEQVSINTYATEHYDHTFTENLINVVTDEEYGLYQARPKTAFDKVVAQKHEAEENVASYRATLEQLKEDLRIYTSLQLPALDEAARLEAKCTELIEQFESEYDALVDMTNEILEEYFDAVYEGYLTAEVERESIFSRALAVRLGAAFAMGAAVAFILFVGITSARDNVQLRRRMKLMEKVKAAAHRKGA